MTAIELLRPEEATATALLGDSESVCQPEAAELTVRLRLTHRKPFRFLHGGVLHGLMCGIFGHDLPRGLAVWPAESGRVSFESGDPYVFSLVLVGPARRRIAEVEPALHRIAAEPFRRGPRKVLGGNFLVESVTAREIGGDVESSGADRMKTDASGKTTLRFLSPLRLKRPKQLAMAGASHLDQSCFPAAHFLRRLYQRWHLLTFGAYPKAQSVPAPPAGVVASPDRLVWVDLPMRGQAGHQKGGRPTEPKTLGGVLGRVTFSGLEPYWLRLLEVMQPFHAGAQTHYGFGRYVLEDRSAAAPVAPGRRHIDDIASTRRLADAVEREARTGGAGSDGVTPEAFLAGGASQLDAIAEQLRAGTYRPDPLCVHDGYAIPTVRDRVVQRALVGRIGPVVDELRENLAGRNGTCELPRNHDELAALLPMDPAAELVNSFSRAPVLAGGSLKKQNGEFRVVSPLVALFRPH